MEVEENRVREPGYDQLEEAFKAIATHVDRDGARVYEQRGVWGYLWNKFRNERVRDVIQSYNTQRKVTDYFAEWDKQHPDGGGERMGRGEDGEEGDWEDEEEEEEEEDGVEEEEDEEEGEEEEVEEDMQEQLVREEEEFRREKLPARRVPAQGGGTGSEPVKTREYWQVLTRQRVAPGGAQNELQSCEGGDKGGGDMEEEEGDEVSQIKKMPMLQSLGG